jgi:cytochrome c5
MKIQIIISMMFWVGCAEEQKDFSFSVSSGSSTEEAQEPASNNVSEPEPTEEPSPINEPEEEIEDCSIPPETTDLPPRDLEGRVDCGEEVYMLACANCHGVDGEGTPNGQGLIGHIQGHSDSDLIHSIVDGEGTMPPQDLESQEVADVIAYMRVSF